MNRALISILIPAYNNTRSLIRALETLAEQTISKQLLIIVSDDHSPCPIYRDEVIAFKSFFFDLKLIRQNVNLGVLSNKEWLFNQVNTDFFAFMEHDDWLIRNDFYERAINYLKEDQQLCCFYGNAVTEPGWITDENGILSSFVIGTYRWAGEKIECVEHVAKFGYYINQSSLKGIKENLIMQGQDFAYNLSKSNASIPFVSSQSALVFSTFHVRNIGGFGGSYTISLAESRALDIYREEEHFGLLYLLASRFKFKLEETPSITRGWDPKSFSRNFTEHPAKFMKQDCAFYAYYKLAWFISNGFTQNIDKEVIRLLYSFCIRIGLVVQTDASQNFLESYLPAEQEIKEMAQYTINRAKKRFSS